MDAYCNNTDPTEIDVATVNLANANSNNQNPSTLLPTLKFRRHLSNGSSNELIHHPYTICPRGADPQERYMDNVYPFKSTETSYKSGEMHRFGGVEANRYRLILNTPFSSRSTISYGLIVYAKDTQRWVIIQRKHSIEFLLFIRGLYRLTYLPFLLSHVTDVEADVIRKCLEGGPAIFEQVYLHELDLEEKGLAYALIRMAESRTITMNLLSKLDFSQNDLSWSWPKGRQSYSGFADTTDRETPFACARREFIEEVEIKLPPPLFISDSYLSTNFHTLTGRTIESRFWIYVIPTEIPIPPIESHPEVSNRLWVDTETCAKLIPRNSIFKEVLSIVASID